jgi:hypothetical protein
MSFNPKPQGKIDDRDWTTHTWNKGGIRGDYGSYRDMIQSDILGGYGDDDTFDRNELNKITGQLYDIRGDSRAPHRGNYFDEGAATQDAIARLITTKGIKTSDDILKQYGLRQDQATGDIISSAGSAHSAFGSDPASFAGYGSKADFAGSHYSYDDFAEGKVPTWRYKYQGDWTPTTTTPTKPAILSDVPEGDPTDTQQHSDNQKEYLKFTYGDDDTSVKIKKGFDDPDIKAALLGEFMKAENLNADGSYKYVTPGRRLGIDLTYPEQRGAIPYVSHAQYMKNFIKAPQLGSASRLASELKTLADLKA